MDFIKKHYEKVLLGVVLLGLTVAVAALPFIVSSKREKLTAMTITLMDPKIKPLTNVNVKVLDEVLQRAPQAVHWDFTHSDNFLVNPILWQKSGEGVLKKGEARKQGPEVLEILNITPLYLRLAFDSASGTGFFINFTNEIAAPGKQKSGQRLAQKNVKGDYFTLRDVQGPPENPQLSLELASDGQVVTVGPGQPFERIEGYEADLKYPLESGKTWKRLRRDSSLNFAGETYKIVAITSSNVVISADQNKKKTTITYKP